MVITMDIALLKKYFELEKKEEDLLLEYTQLLVEWNNKINLISRKDTENVLERHILHALGVLACGNIESENQSIIDVGTGGGLPGIPLAICLPNNNFTLADSIAKKILACNQMVQDLDIQNADCVNTRVENLQTKYDIVTGRAVTRLLPFYSLTKNLLKKGGRYLLLKGGDLGEEIYEFENQTKLKVKKHALKEYFEEEFFETKYVLEIIKK